MITNIKNIVNNTAKPIQKGHKTQTQGQSIIPQSLRTINTIPNNPAKEIPPDDTLLVTLTLSDIIF